jgi:hypothetical protein
MARSHITQEGRPSFLDSLHPDLIGGWPNDGCIWSGQQPFEMASYADLPNGLSNASLSFLGLDPRPTGEVIVRPALMSVLGRKQT